MKTNLPLYFTSAVIAIACASISASAQTQITGTFIFQSSVVNGAVTSPAPGYPLSNPNDFFEVMACSANSDGTLSPAPMNLTLTSPYITMYYASQWSRGLTLANYANPVTFPYARVPNGPGFEQFAGGDTYLWTNTMPTAPAQPYTGFEYGGLDAHSQYANIYNGPYSYQGWDWVLLSGNLAQDSAFYPAAAAEWVVFRDIGTQDLPSYGIVPVTMVTGASQADPFWDPSMSVLTLFKLNSSGNYTGAVFQVFQGNWFVDAFQTTTANTWDQATNPPNYTVTINGKTGNFLSVGNGWYVVAQTSSQWATWASENGYTSVPPGGGGGKGGPPEQQE